MFGFSLYEIAIHLQYNSLIEIDAGRLHTVSDHLHDTVWHEKKPLSFTNVATIERKNGKRHYELGFGRGVAMLLFVVEISARWGLVVVHEPPPC